jgi:hypothetical protein
LERLFFIFLYDLQSQRYPSIVPTFFSNHNPRFSFLF